MGRGFVIGSWSLLLTAVSACGASSTAVPTTDAASRDAIVAPHDVAADIRSADGVIATDVAVDAPDVDDRDAALDAPAISDAPDAAVTPGDPARCDASPVVRASTVFTDQRLSRSAQSASDCAGSSPPALFYRVALGAGQRLVAAVDTFTARVRVLEACDASTCLAREDTAVPPRSVYSNRGASEQRVVVAVSARDGLTADAFALTLTITTLPPANTCATAPVVSDGASVTGTLADTTAVAPRCDGTTARSIFYAVDVPAGRRLAVQGNLITRPAILEGCDATACLGASWVTGPGTSSARVWTNPGPDTRRVVVALSPNSEGASPFSLGATVSIASPIAESTCATARTLTPGVEVGPFSAASSGELLTPCATGGAAEPALWWRVTVPAGRRVVVTQRLVTLSPMSVASGLAMVDGCGARSCLAGWSGLPSTALPMVGAWRNDGDRDREVYVVAYGASSTFTLSAQFADAAPTCAGAPMLEVDRALTAQRLIDAETLAAICATGASPRAARLYQVMVPPGQRVVVRVSSSVASLAVRVLDGCDTMACLATATSTSGADRDTSTARWTNASASTRAALVAVSHGEFPMGLGGEFDVTATLEPAVSNARCATAISLAPGSTVTGDAADAVERVTDCASSSLPSLYYRVVVPAGQRLEVGLQGPGLGLGADDTRVRVVEGCGATACLGAPVTRNQTTWTNAAAEPRAVLVAVSPRVSLALPFSLSATLVTPASNGRCAAATRLTGDADVTGLGAADAVEADAACGGSALPALYFRVEVPSHHRLVVNASLPEAASTLALLDRCDAATCLAAPSADASSMSWVNATSESREVVIALRRATLASFAATGSLSTRGYAVSPEGICATAPESTAESSLDWASAGQSVTTCGAELATQAAIYRAVVVPAGQRLTATLRSFNLRDEGLRVLSSCDVPTCLTPWTTRGGSRTELVTTWRNEGTSPRRVIVAASQGTESYDPSPRLSLEVGP